MPTRRLVFLTTLFLTTIVWVTGAANRKLQAGQYNEILEIGDKAPVWMDLRGVDGETHGSADYADSAATVIVFTCNSCPYATDVEDRLIWLHENYSPRGVAVVAINSNTIEEDRLPAMKTRAEAKSFSFTYVSDPAQETAKQFGAKFTPQFFVLDDQQRVVYMGSMDDSPDGNEVTKPYVASALDAVLADQKPEVQETVPIGCLIRFNRSRQSRPAK